MFGFFRYCTCVRHTLCQQDPEFSLDCRVYFLLLSCRTACKALSPVHSQWGSPDPEYLNPDTVQCLETVAL